MKWFLVIMLLQGGVAAIPMDSHRACVDAQHKIEISGANLVRTSCISQGE